MSLWSFDKDLSKEFDEKYKIKIKKIEKGGLVLYQFFIEDTDFDTGELLFTKDEETGYYEPYIYNYRINKDGKAQGSIIKKDSCYYYWILTVRKLFSRYNNKKRKRENGSLYVLQWLLSFRILDNILNKTGRTIQLIGTRQSTRGCL